MNSQSTKNIEPNERALKEAISINPAYSVSSNDIDLLVAVAKGIKDASLSYDGETPTLFEIQTRAAQLFRRLHEKISDAELQNNNPFNQVEDVKEIFSERGSNGEFVDAHTIAAAIGVSHWSVYKWASQGIIPSIRAGRKRRFDIGQVIKKLQTKKEETCVLQNDRQTRRMARTSTTQGNSKNKEGDRRRIGGKESRDVNYSGDRRGAPSKRSGRGTRCETSPTQGSSQRVTEVVELTRLL